MLFALTFILHRHYCLEEHLPPDQTQTGLGPRFIFSLPQAAVRPGSDAGSDLVKPASNLIIQNCQTLCSMWCLMYGACY